MKANEQIVDEINKELILNSQNLLSDSVERQVFYIGDKLNFCGKQYEVKEILSNGFIMSCIGDTKLETGIEYIDDLMKEGIDIKNII